MRLLDYLRLGGANIAAHRRRAVLVTVIVGVIFGVLMAGSILIQGIENAALEAVLRPTGGKVWLSTVARQDFCGDECDLEADQAEIRQMIAEHGGEELAVKVPAGMFSVYAVEAEAVRDAIEVEMTEVPEGALPVLADVTTLAGWLKLPALDRNVSGERRARRVEEIREQALGKVIEYGGQRYFVAGVLPGGLGVSNLSLTAVGDKKNLLNMLLESAWVGNSRTLVIDNGSLETEPTEEIWAEFGDLSQAQAYVEASMAQNCIPIEQAVGRCVRVKVSVVTLVIGDPLVVWQNFSSIWLVFKIVAIVLAAIGSIVALSTYTRLVGRDTKVIALYHALGASKRQIAGVYCTYLLGLSLLAGVFSLFLGVVSVVIINLLNMTKLMQVFTIGFGTEEVAVWLLGGNGWLVGLFGLLLVLAPVATLLNLHQFSSKKLSQKMK